MGRVGGIVVCRIFWNLLILVDLIFNGFGVCGLWFLEISMGFFCGFLLAVLIWLLILVGIFLFCFGLVDSFSSDYMSASTNFL